MRSISHYPKQIIYIAIVVVVVAGFLWSSTTTLGAAPAVSKASSPRVTVAYPESAHPYANNFDYTWTWQSGTDATFLDIAFDSQTMLGAGDQLYIMDSYGTNVSGSPFTGATLAGATIRVPGANAQIRLLTDGAGTAWGFKVSSVTPLSIPAPDLWITKSHDGTFAVGQTGAKYSIFVRNIGTGPTTDVVTVTDVLPAGLTATSIAGEGWTCVQPGGPCQRSDVLSSRGSYPQITLTVSVGPQNAGTIVNVATVSGGGDSNTGNNTTQDPTDIESKAPDLAIRKTHGGDFAQGQVGATYTILVSNVGQGPTTGVVTVTDTIPAGLTATAISGTGWTCTQPAGPCTRNDSLLNNSIYPGITVTVNVAANAPSSVTNTATVSTTGDTNSNNDTFNDVTKVMISSTDLTITKSHSGNFQQGQSGATYTLVVTNTGNVASSGTVTVTDTPPAQFTITSMTGGGWTCVQPAGPCTRSDSLPSTLSYQPITVTGTVASPSLGSIINVASVSGGGDSNSTNNTASDPTTVLASACNPLPESAHPYANNFDYTWTCVVAGSPQSVDVTFDPQTSVENGADYIYITDANGVNITGSPFTGVSLAGNTKNVPGDTVKIRLVTNAQNPDWGFKVTNIAPGAAITNADLTIAKTHSGSFYQGQRGAQYTIIVSNGGTGPSSGQVTVTDTVPSGMVATGIAGTGWTCTQPAGPCTRSDSLAAASSYPAITLTVNVSANAPASLTNSVSVSGGSDTNSNNNTATDPTTVVPPVPSCSPLPESTHPYDNSLDQSWTCVVPGSPASLAVSFDPQTLFDDGGGDMLYITDANGNNITGSPFTGASLAGVTVNVPGDTAKFRFVTDVRRTAWGFKVTNIAIVGSTDPDLTITKTHSGSFSQGQTGATYTIVVKNVGGAATNAAVSVTDNLPVGLTATNIAGSGWTCTQPFGPCTRTDALQSGQSYPAITLTVNVAQNAPSLVTNTVTVSGGGDLTSGNNNYGDSTTIVTIGCVLPESAHPYSTDYDNTWTCTLAGSLSSLSVVFDGQTSIDPTDLLYVMDANGVNISGSPFTGTTLAGQTVNVTGNTVKIRLVSDSRRTDWGFKVDSVTGLP